MYALAEMTPLHGPKRDPGLGEIAEILEVRRRVLADPAAAYLPPLARLLIEDEIPRLIALLSAPRSRSGGARRR